jgi:hypothetical protein
LSGVAGLGRDLPETRPGCGAKNIEPGVIERLKARFDETGLKSRRIEIGEDEDEQEAMFARGWSDGLPWHCQLKRPWYAPRVGGAPARVGELLCSPFVLPRSAERGRKKAPSVR